MIRKYFPLILSIFFSIYALPAHAYIGPGAGFAFLGSTFVFILTIGMAFLTILTLPLRFALRKFRRARLGSKARAKRVVILGLDGLEPKLVDEYMQAGALPNLKKLSETGSYERLKTTLPALSPVAWSSFQTGVNPGAHNIFDFLTRDKRFCLPQLASTEIAEGKKIFNLFGFKIPYGTRSEIRITRKSTPFWTILGRYGIFSNVIRVPISYPAEKFNGNILSAMCTPDIKGTQGSFTFYTTGKAVAEKREGGTVKNFSEKEGKYFGTLEGPPKGKSAEYFTEEFSLEKRASKFVFKLGKQEVFLNEAEFSNWLEVKFAKEKISGIFRVCLRSTSPDISLYISPVNVNPEKPALPIAAPIYFASWLAKKLGLFGTLGLMEDTWGRNEGALDDASFLEQTYLAHNERECMFMEALERTREGVCVGVFDASDRIQHMFWRYLDPKHPSPRESEKFSSVIPEMYKKMDELVGKVKAKLKKDDIFIVLSDHGFSSFRRCINLNAWLRDNGYLFLKDNQREGRDYFQDVDWERTRAFAVGLSGLYINKQGRERLGIVSQQDFSALKQEIAKKLELLKDPQDQSQSIRKVYDTAIAYRGLYAEEAPDLVVGYAPGYRVSWDSVTGTVEPEIFSDNLKAWSGDHHVDPELVPGILFTNVKLKEKAPSIIDLAPTVLDLFAVPVPKYMEGRVIV